MDSNKNRLVLAFSSPFKKVVRILWLYIISINKTSIDNFSLDQKKYRNAAVLKQLKALSSLRHKHKHKYKHNESYVVMRAATT